MIVDIIYSEGFLEPESILPYNVRLKEYKLFSGPNHIAHTVFMTHRNLVQSNDGSIDFFASLKLQDSFIFMANTPSIFNLYFVADDTYTWYKIDNKTSLHPEST